MYILYNGDGSVKAIKLTDYIQKGNNNVNSIFLAIEGKTNSEWAATIVFILPDGSAIPITPTTKTESIFGTTYSGWSVSIPSAVTIYEGQVIFSVTVLNLQSQILFTYRGKLTINPSAIIPDITSITYNQYQTLLQYILSILATNGQSPQQLDELLALIDSKTVYRHEIRVRDQSNDQSACFEVYTNSQESILSVASLRTALGGANVENVKSGYYVNRDDEYYPLYSVSVGSGSLITLKCISAEYQSLTSQFTIAAISDNVRQV